MPTASSHETAIKRQSFFRLKNVLLLYKLFILFFTLKDKNTLFTLLQYLQLHITIMTRVG
jgi:hypothetical protein